MMVTELPTGLAEWMRHQRWYASKGRAPQLERRGGWSIRSGDATIVTHYVLDRQQRGATLYQVPLTHRTLPLDGATALWRDDEGYAYDGPHDPEYARAILGLIDAEDVVEDARGHHQPGARRVTIESTAVLKGEQSNTSIICATGDATPVILKVFRAMHAGDNPDVVLQSAISASGSALVPASLGFLSGEWPDRSEPDGIARGQLAFAQDFLSDAEDGWRIALRAARELDDFTARAGDLGRATATMHETLAAVLPTAETTPDDIVRFLDGMRSRAESAIAEVPELEPLRDRIESVIASAASVRWPRLQRIHGDYHLGQVLSSSSAGADGWIVIDFEGEPLRPMRERSAVDIRMRDVAGMVRSFDYVAGAVAHDAQLDPPIDATHWAGNARVAFLDGYFAVAGGEEGDHHELLDAFELDKALYEAVYEVRNRPDWLGIPVSAIRRLIGT